MHLFCLDQTDVFTTQQRCLTFPLVHSDQTFTQYDLEHLKEMIDLYENEYCVLFVSTCIRTRLSMEQKKLVGCLFSINMTSRRCQSVLFSVE